MSPLPSHFGSAIRDEWPLEPGLVYLNHGTVGVTPRLVMDAQEAIRREIESNPSLHILRTISRLVGSPGEGRLREAAARVAEFVAASSDDLVFVENATTGINGILRSLDLGPDDVVLTTEKTYGGVRQAVRYACRQTGASVSVARLPCPIAGPEDVLAALDEALVPGTRLAVLDHIISEIGVVLPVREMAELCHGRGARVVIDGAHAPGQLPLDIPALGVDAYSANLHKWALAPRSCGILWVDPDWQSDIHPAVMSWGLDEGFVREFDWTGTRDPSAALAAPAALDLLEELGFDRISEYNHELLWRAVGELGTRWGTEPVAPESMSAFMIALPLPPGFEASPERAEALRATLADRHRIEVPAFAWGERLWLRLSVQVYNDWSDFERLAAAIEEEG